MLNTDSTLVKDFNGLSGAQAPEEKRYCLAVILNNCLNNNGYKREAMSNLKALLEDHKDYLDELEKLNSQSNGQYQALLNDLFPGQHNNIVSVLTK